MFCVTSWKSSHFIGGLKEFTFYWRTLYCIVYSSIDTTHGKDRAPDLRSRRPTVTLWTSEMSLIKWEKYNTLFTSRENCCNEHMKVLNKPYSAAPTHFLFLPHCYLPSRLKASWWQRPLILHSIYHTICWHIVDAQQIVDI